VLNEPDQLFFADRIEEGRYVGVENEVHSLGANPDRQRVQRIVLATFWSEPVAEAEEVLLINGIQHRDGRPLDDLVLQGRDRERALFPIRLRYVRPA
jgi:hypothetical protein